MRKTIFADGASKGNPGPGGWGALVADGETVKELGGRDEHTTNNRMELTAVIEALVLACGRGDEVVVHTDSSYVINGITKWVKGWKVRSWVTKQNQPVLNQDLWKKLASLVDTCGGKIHWKHVGGHVGVAGNERVDEIASNYADGKPVALYDGPRETYGIDIENVSHDESKMKARSASRSRSSAKAYSYVSEVGGVVQVHKTWAECEARVRGKKARFKKALSAQDEADIVRAFST